jgi:hypothetical protein
MSEEYDLSPPTVTAFLEFFKSCIEVSAQSTKIDAFALGLFDVTWLYPAIARLFSVHSPKDHLELLFRLLVASQSPKIFQFIEPFAIQLSALAVSRQSDFVPDLLKCLISPLLSISLFAAGILASMSNDDAVLEQLLPLEGLLRARQSADESPAFSQLLSALSQDPFRSRVFQQPRDTSATPFARLKDAESRLLSAELPQDSEFLTTADPQRKFTTKVIPVHSLSRLLEHPLSASDGPAPHQSELPSPQVAAARPQAPRAAGIVAMVYKLGGFQRGTWQRRVFEYHPLAKCIVWRQGRQSPAKGFILVGAGVTVSRAAKAVKGKTFVMEISTDARFHQIAFDTQGELDKWLVTLEAARVQQ